MENALKPWNYAISTNADTSKYLQLMAQIIYKMNALSEPINRLNDELSLIESSATSVYDDNAYSNQYISKLNEYNKLLNEYQGLQNEYDLILTSAIHHDNQNINKHNHKWIQLSSLPGTPFSNAVKINEHEFIFAIYNEHQLLNYNAIYCYNNHTNKWRKFLTYPPNFSIAQDSPISYNTNKKELYLCNGLITDETNDIWNANPMFAKININADDPEGDDKSEWTFFEATRQEFASSSLMIDGDLHLFGGCNNTTHRSYNIMDDFDDEKHSKNDDAVIEKKCFYDFGENGGNEWVLGNVQHGLVYVESQKRIILFGGMNIPNYPKAFDMFWDFDLVKKKWRRLTDLRLPYKMYGFGHVLSADQGVIITFGGGRERNSYGGVREFGYEFMDEIYVIDINKKVIKQSEIKCPLKGIYHAISMIDDNKILKNGFLRECMKEYGMNIPFDLRNLMGLFYVEEYVHILHRETCRHWKINITEIIDNC